MQKLKQGFSIWFNRQAVKKSEKSDSRGAATKQLEKILKMQRCVTGQQGEDHLYHGIPYYYIQMRKLDNEES